MEFSAFISKTRNTQKSPEPCEVEAHKTLLGGLAYRQFSPWICGTIVLSSLVLSVTIFHYAERNIRLNALLEFRKTSISAEESIRQKVMAYGQVLTGTTAHMGSHAKEEAGAHNEMEHESLDNYVASLGLRETFPSIINLGLVGFDGHVVDYDLHDAHDDHAAHDLGETLLHGPEENHVGPVSRLPKANTSITHIAPLQRHKKMLGLDLGADKSCNAALNFARESKDTRLTPRLTIMNGDKREPGFFLVRPIYAPLRIADNGEVLEDRFLGWAMASFVLKNMIEELGAQLGEEYNLTLFDGELLTPRNIVFENVRDDEYLGDFLHESYVNLYGRKWTLRFSSTPAFDVAHESFLPTGLLLVGLLVSFLFWFAARSNALRSRVLISLTELRERQLDAHKDENRTLLEASVMAVMTLDKRSRVTFVNSTALELFGLSEKALLGEPFEKFVSVYKNVKAGDIANAIGCGGNETPLLLDVQTSTWRTADDDIQTTALIRDVTENVTNRLTLEAVQERYDVALSGAEIGVFEVNLRDGTAILSETSRRIMGGDLYSDTFDQERDFYSRIHPDDLDQLYESDRKCIEGETERTKVEYRLRFPEGWRWMYTDAVSVGKGPDGRADRLIGTQRDITEVRHARNALELSEARFRMMMEEAPVGTAILGEKGAFIKVNKALAALTGYDAESQCLNIRLADILSRKDFVRMTHDIRGLLRSREAKAYQNQFELKTRSGEIRWGLFNFSWTFDKNRNENVYIMQVIDITDQKMIEKVKGEFVSTVSHELRTPLTSVKGALGLLEVSAANTLTESAKRLLEIARVNADRLTVMVNDILDLERLKSGAIVFESEDVSLSSIVAHTVESMTSFAKEHQNTIVLSGMDDAVDVNVDVGRFRQVLTNLLSNACKFSNAETPVVVHCVPRDDDVIVNVENTGPAVPDSFRSSLFEAFTQVDASDTRSMGGTGLGLHIASQIVLRLGGEIGCDHNDEGQTIFWFTCPRSFAEMDQGGDGPLEGTWQNGQILRVLHVEDDTDFADIISASFGNLACVSHAANLEQARALISAETYDVVLLDWALPDGHASVLLDEIYEHLPDVVVVALSATNDVFDDRVSLSITKSQVDTETIVRQVQRASAYLPEIAKKASM
ncbi:MAG: PAS domain S-box protein [Sulfitobacter sp.]